VKRPKSLSRVPPKTSGGRPSGPFPDSMLAANSFEIVINAIKEYSIVQEQEQTKREDIWARRDVALAAIVAERDVLLTYMEHVFVERHRNFAHFFEMMDKGIMGNDSELIQKAMEGVLATILTSPFADLADFRKKAKDPNYLLEI
jgi:hypothetical protein